MNPCRDPFATSHFSNPALLADLDQRVAHDRKSFAVILTRIAEIDERRLYLAEGYSCMKAFCMERMRLTEGAAYKRLTTARLARQYPGILVALADGRLHMRAVLMLGPHLTSANADELVAAAADKTRFELDLLLARRFPRPDVPDRLEPIASSPAATLMAAELAPAPAGALAPERVQATMPDECGHAEAPSSVATRPLAPERVDASGPRSRVTPLSPGRYGFQGTWDQEGYDLYHEVRALMSHEVPTGELALVLQGALRIARAELQKRKFGATARPGRSRASASPRSIPAAVRRAVQERDGGRCAFVSEAGQRCAETRFLEFDHIDPVARGGEATVANLRLVCSAHNRYAAERVFGAEFMSRKREEARRAPRETRAAKQPVLPQHS
jgi:5-methylcytosine-specific restriction endonuclease McrA